MIPIQRGIRIPFWRLSNAAGSLRPGLTQALKTPLLKLRDIEKNARNLAAHTIIPVTEDFVQHSCGCSSIRIMELIQSAAAQVLASSNLTWNSYELMNDHIKKAITALPVDADTTI